MRSLSRPGILKSCDYRNTNEITMGVRVLRSGPRQGCEPDQLRTPPGLTLEEWRDLASEIEQRQRKRHRQASGWRKRPLSGNGERGRLPIGRVAIRRGICAGREEASASARPGIIA